MDAHAWWTEQLKAAMAEASAAGIAQDVSVAVITDVVNSAVFSPQDVVPDENWNQDIGEPDYMVNENQPIASEPTDASPGAAFPTLTRTRRF